MISLLQPITCNWGGGTSRTCPLDAAALIVLETIESGMAVGR